MEQAESNQAFELYELDPRLPEQSLELTHAARPDAEGEAVAQQLKPYGPFTLTVSPHELWKGFVAHWLTFDMVEQRAGEALAAGSSDPFSAAFEGIDSDQRMIDRDRRLSDPSTLSSEPPRLTVHEIDAVQALRYFDGLAREVLPRAILICLQAAAALSRGAANQLVTEEGGQLGMRNPLADPRAPLPPLPPDAREEVIRWMESELRRAFTPNARGPEKTSVNVRRWSRYQEIENLVRSNPSAYESFAPTVRGGNRKPVESNIETTARKALMAELREAGDNLSDQGLKLSLARGEEEGKATKAPT
jgi:hypothetical protein